MIDADKTRALVEVRFEEQNTRDADRTLVELSKLLQGTDATPKTAAKYVEQVKAAKENIAKYEGLLNKEMSVARMKVEVLDGQVKKLIEKIAQQPPVTPAKKEEKKPVAGTPAGAIVVPHHEPAQASTTQAGVTADAGIAPAAEVVTVAAPVQMPEPSGAPAVVANSTITLVQTGRTSVFTSEKMAAMEQSIREAEAKEPGKDPEFIPAEPLVPPAKETQVVSVQTALQDVEPGNTNIKAAAPIAVSETVEAPVTEAVSSGLNPGMEMVVRQDDLRSDPKYIETFNTPAGSPRVTVNHAEGVLVLTEEVLDRESNIEVRAEVQAQQENGHEEHITERIMSTTDFTTESLLLG